MFICVPSLVVRISWMRELHNVLCRRSFNRIRESRSYVVVDEVRRGQALIFIWIPSLVVCISWVRERRDVLCNPICARRPRRQGGRFGESCGFNGELCCG